MRKQIGERGRLPSIYEEEYLRGCDVLMKNATQWRISSRRGLWRQHQGNIPFGGVKTEMPNECIWAAGCVCGGRRSTGTVRRFSILELFLNFWNLFFWKLQHCRARHTHTHKARTLRAEREKLKNGRREGEQLLKVGCVAAAAVVFEERVEREEKRNFSFLPSLSLSLSHWFHSDLSLFHWMTDGSGTHHRAIHSNNHTIPQSCTSSTHWCGGIPFYAKFLDLPLLLAHFRIYHYPDLERTIPLTVAIYQLATKVS